MPPRKLLAALLCLLSSGARPALSQRSCSRDSDCSSGQCAREEAFSSAGKICCEDGVVYSGSISISNVCGGRAVGKACSGINAICESGVCGVDKVCLAEKIPDDLPCTNDDQCASGMCAREEAFSSAGKICCEDGDVYSGSISISNVCNKRAAGKACNGKNAICESGVCGVDKVCLAEKIPDELPCANDDQCASGMCGRSEALETAGNVCCAAGKTSYLGSRLGRVCADLAAGKACSGEGGVCASGSCDSNGACTRLLAGAPCGDDDDACENGTCGRTEALADAGFACCPGGEKLAGGASSLLEVCVGIGETGDACFDDSICKSAICIAGACVEGKWEEESDPCEKGKHCASGVCTGVGVGGDGVGSCGPFPSLASRNQYFNSKARCPLGTLDNSGSDGGGTIVLGVYGDSSSSAWSNSITNIVTTPKRDNTATLNYVEGQELLSGIFGCHGGGSVVAQRQGDQVCFAYQRQDDDGDGNVGTACREKCVRIGGSGTFETYDKSDTDVVGGVFGTPVQVFYFGESRDCRINVEWDVEPTTTTEATTTTTITAKATATTTTTAVDAEPTTTEATVTTTKTTEAMATTTTTAEEMKAATTIPAKASAAVTTVGTSTISGTPASVAASETEHSATADAASEGVGSEATAAPEEADEAPAQVATGEADDAPRDISDLLNANGAIGLTTGMVAALLPTMAILAFFCGSIQP